MSSVHVARQGFITKSALPNVSRVRGTAQVADKSTVLLLNGNGTNGAQNNTFLDASTNNFSITRNGNATQGSFSPFTLPDGQWSNFFDGTGDFLSVPNTSALEFGTGDFTVEFWMYRTTTGNTTFIHGSTNSTGNFGMNISSGSIIIYSVGGSAVNYTNTTTAQSWNHIAVTRSGTTLTLYINGVSQGTRTFTNNITGLSGNTVIGAETASTNFFTGYISNLRVVKGTAVYTSAFTPSTTPLTAITNTSLLTCQSNRFRDNSSNNFAITRNGDVRVTPWSPFAPTSAYDPATNGGSGYFDGTGDWLAVPHNTAFNPESSDFTVECWFNITGNSALNAGSTRGATLLSKRNTSGNSTGWDLSLTGNSTTTGTGITFQFTQSDNNFLSISYTATIPQNCWNHVAVTRSGNSFTIYFNGVSVQTATITQAVQTNTQALIVGGTLVASYEQRLVGYLASVRIVKGTAVAPPSGGYTAPVTNITNTSLLLNFTNAGIFDTAGDFVIETVGNSQIDTAVKRYGSGSLEFDGNGDMVLINNASNTPQLIFGTEDLTIEAWINVAGAGSEGSSAQLGMIFGKTSVNGGAANFFNESFNTDATNRTITFNANTADGQTQVQVVTPNNSINLNQWHHVAFVKSGTTWTIYVDGVNRVSATRQHLGTTTGFFAAVGRNANSSSFKYPFNGYIDDLRITKGQARYTANFTPPTAELITYGTSENIVNNSTYGVYQLA